MFKLWLYAYQTNQIKSNPGTTVTAKKVEAECCFMTYKLKMFKLRLCAYQTKPSNPANAVAAKNPAVFYLLMTKNDL